MADGRDHSTRMGETWGDDTIYSESVCRPEDVFYEGSEDDEYDGSASRRLRYEQAAQRFLKGNVPVLISAALTGPFDSRSGFTNPWLSNRHQAVAGCRTQASGRVVRPTTTEGKNSGRWESSQQPSFPPPATVSHLPSPESLKQAPYTQQHPYLEADELEKVNKWREQVSPSRQNKGDFWATGQTEDLSIKKRRASGSEWLKKVSAKRQRHAITQPTPYQRVLDDAGLDELMADIPSSSITNSAHLGSPSKRRSPRNAFRRGSAKKLVESDDELSPNKAAAATLSSPVSLKNVTTNQPLNYFPPSKGSQVTPSRLRHVDVMNAPSKDKLLQDEGTHGGDSNLQDADEEDNGETTETSSNCYSTVQSEPEIVLNKDGNISESLPINMSTVPDKTNEGVVSPGSSDNGLTQHTPWLSPKRENSGAQSLFQEINHDTEMDDQIHDLSNLMSAPQDLTKEDNAALQIKDAELDSQNESEESNFLILQHPSIADEEQSSSRHANQESAAFVGALGVDKANTLCTMAAMNDNVRSAPDSSGLETPTTPQMERVNETSEFSLRNIFNRFVPSSPWAKLSQLTGSASPSPAKSPGNNTTMVDCTSQTEQDDAKIGTSSFPIAQGDEATNSAEHLLVEHREIGCKTVQSLDSTERVSPEHLEITTQPSYTASTSRSGQASKASFKDDYQVPESQQSPSAESEHVILPASPLRNLLSKDPGAKLLCDEAGEKDTRARTTEDESPWAQNAPATARPSSLLSSSTETSNQTLFVKPAPPRPRTPEPQFCVNSFSSFMSPSPDRKGVNRISLSSSASLLKGSHKCLPSVLKSQWSQQRPRLHVSWSETLEESEETPSHADDATAAHQLKRQCSPPPEALASSLQAKQDTKFAKHFEAVVNRNTRSRPYLITTESQQLQSAGPFATAEMFMVVDTKNPNLEFQSDENMELAEPLACSRASEEPMDVLEDMVNEMGDSWGPWDIDAELDCARKEVSNSSASTLS